MWSLLAASAMSLAACSSDDEVGEGSIGYVAGFLGGVAADEPRAALIGRDILSAGGTAADAAVAVYFALSVTLPSTASLGGGGICLVNDYPQGTTEALEFLARAPASVPATATRPSAIPGNPRGFYTLHSRYGRLRWEQLVSPAETLARFGIRVSRALANDLTPLASALAADPEVRRVFASGDGDGLVGEGGLLTQLDLSVTLSRLRIHGPGDFYAGNGARILAEAVNRAGGSLSVEDLRNYLPRWTDTIEVPFGNETIHFAKPPAAAGAVAAQMWSMLVDDGRYENASAGERPHLFVETAMRAFADRGQWMNPDGSSAVEVSELISELRIDRLMSDYGGDRRTPAASLDKPPAHFPENPAATSFVVVDQRGSAVACTLTMNSLFGIGRLAPGTGIIPAAIPGSGGRGPISLVPMMVINHHVNEFYFAAAATGGVTAPTALLNVALGALIDGKPLEEAINDRRLHHGGEPDLVFYEQGYDADALRSLSERDHNLAATPKLGLVNAIYCSGAIPPAPESCISRTDDTRGFGLARGAD